MNYLDEAYEAMSSVCIWGEFFSPFPSIIKPPPKPQSLSLDPHSDVTNRNLVELQGIMEQSGHKFKLPNSRSGSRKASFDDM
jgi:hypothetical protein